MTNDERELDLQLGDALARIAELEREVERLRVRLRSYEPMYSSHVLLGLSNGPFCTAYHFTDESTGETD